MSKQEQPAELFAVEGIKPVAKVQPQPLTEDTLPIGVFFTHAILVSDPELDVLRSLAKERGITIYRSQTERPFLRHKRINPHLSGVVFATSRRDWEVLRGLAESIDYFHQGQYYRPFWESFPTEELPMPIPIQPIIHVLGLIGADTIYKPVKDRGTITFDRQLQSQITSTLQAEAAELHYYHKDISKLIQKHQS